MSKRSLPTVVSPIPRDLRTFIDRLRDMLTDGSADRMVTAKDLADAGLASVSGSGAIAPPAGSGVTPPAPTGVSATASLSTIFVEWDAPTYAGHAYAEVWASPTNSIGSAVRTGMAPGGIFVDSLEFDTTRYYWVRFVSVGNTAGAFNAVSGVGATTGQDVDKLVAAMTGPGEPFKVVATQTTLPDGSIVPAGTYTADAFIHNGQITNAKIANLAVTNAKISDLSVSKLKAGSIAVGEYAQSTGYAAGSAGWRIDGNGNAEFSNATVRGTVYATAGEFTGTVKVGSTILGGATTAYGSGTGFYAGLDSAVYKWRVGNPTGARVQWTGSSVEIYNSSNQLTLSSGGAVWSAVSGSGKPADSATNGNNLIRKPTFSDGVMGGWNAQSVSGTDYYGAGEIRVAARDTYELNNDFFVTAGETLYVAGDVYTSTWAAKVGVAFKNAAGTIFGWVGAQQPAPSTPWTRISASVTVPAGAITAIPWLLVDTVDPAPLPQVTLFSKLYIGRQAEGATVGATFGVNIGGQITPSNASTYIANAAIQTAQIADLAVGSAKIADAAITSAKIGNAAIGSAQISDAAITSAKIGNAEVNTLQIAGNAVTIPSSAYTDGEISLSASGSAGTVIQQISFTSTGSSIYIAYDFLLSASAVNQGTVTAELQIKRGPTLIRSILVAQTPQIYEYVSGAFTDIPGSGAVTYQLILVVSAVTSFQSAIATKRSLFTLETKR